jgi:hypothetical protein
MRRLKLIAMCFRGIGKAFLDRQFKFAKLVLAFVLASHMGVNLTPRASIAGDIYSDRASLSGGYFGVLGQYNYARADFVWDTTPIFDQSSHNWGVGGVAGYGWRWGNFYFGPEAYFDYANISNVLAQTVDPVSRLSLEREFGAGVNLLAGFTAFDDAILAYGLLGGGATNFAGSITVNNSSLRGDVWYPVLSVGGGVDWPVSQSLAVRMQARHTFYYDASDHIFPSNTQQSYDLDTTTLSVGLIWRPWN